MANASDLHQITILDSVDRDPRGRKVSVVFVLILNSLEELYSCKAGSDAKEIIIRDVNSVTSDEVGFDHMLVINLLQGDVR